MLQKFLIDDLITGAVFRQRFFKMYQYRVSCQFPYCVGSYVSADFDYAAAKVRHLSPAVEYPHYAVVFLFDAGKIAFAFGKPALLKFHYRPPVFKRQRQIFVVIVLFEMVEKGDYTGAGNAAGQFYDWMSDNFSDSIMDIRLKVLEFVLYAERLLYIKGGRTYIFKSRTDYLSEVMGTDNLGELKKWFVDKMVEISTKIENNKSDKSESLIEKAESFLKNNYMKDISLDDISRYCNISTYYFSKLFKQETGENYVEYLNRIRIENAKKMINESDRSIKDICFSVGFSDPNYFSRIFKKHTGVTPTEYKEGKR